MGKIFFSIILLLVLPFQLYAKDATLNKLQLIVKNKKEFHIHLKLKDGLDLDRMSIIEKGIPVKLTYKIAIYQSNFAFLPDELKYFDYNSQSPKKYLTISKELKYNYITRSYNIKITKNFSCEKKIYERTSRIYAGRNLRESYRILKEDFFEKDVTLCCRLSRLQVSKNESYYVVAQSNFQAVKTFDFPIPIPNKFNFETSTLKSISFKIKNMR